MCVQSLRSLNLFFSDRSTVAIKHKVNNNEKSPCKSNLLTGFKTIASKVRLKRLTFHNRMVIKSVLLS